MLTRTEITVATTSVKIAQADPAPSKSAPTSLHIFRSLLSGEMQQDSSLSAVCYIKLQLHGGGLSVLIVCHHGTATTSEPV
jgi:hypothetical protein